MTCWQQSAVCKVRSQGAPHQGVLREVHGALVCCLARPAMNTSRSLAVYLRQATTSRLTFRFTDLEALRGKALPALARQHTWWFAELDTGFAAWLGSDDWEVEAVYPRVGVVTLRRCP